MKHTVESTNCFEAGDPSPLPFSDIHPAWCAGYGVTGGWLALGASVIGPSHLRRYRSRDDAFLLMGANGCIVAAVADGVGGQMYSRIGAAQCVHTVCRTILSRICGPHVRRYGVDDFDPATLPRELSARGISRSAPPLNLPQAVRGDETWPDAWPPSGTFRWNWSPYRRPFPTDLYEDDDPPSHPPALVDAVSDAYAAAHESVVSLASTLRIRPMQLTCTLLVAARNANTGEAVAARVGDGAVLQYNDLQSVFGEAPKTEEGNPFTMGLDNWANGFASVVPAGEGWLLLTDGAQDFFPEAGEACRERIGSMALNQAGSGSVALLHWLQSLSKPECEDDRTIAAILPLS